MCIKRFKTPLSVFADLSLEQRFTTTSQGVINLSQIYSLNSVISSFRNRIYSGDKVIPEIMQIYPWNRVIPPFRNRPLDFKGDENKFILNRTRWTLCFGITIQNRPKCFTVCKPNIPGLYSASRALLFCALFRSCKVKWSNKSIMDFLGEVIFGLKLNKGHSLDCVWKSASN